MIPEPCFRLQCKHPSPPSLDQVDRPLSSPLMLAGSCSRHRRRRFYPGVGKIPGGGNGNPHQYSCLENPMDRGAWRATVHGVTKSCTTEYLTLSLSTHIYIEIQNISITPESSLMPLYNQSPRDFPGGPVAKTLCSQCKGPGFNPWSGY